MSVMMRTSYTANTSIVFDKQGCSDKQTTSRLQYRARDAHLMLRMVVGMSLNCDRELQLRAALSCFIKQFSVGTV